MKCDKHIHVPLITFSDTMTFLHLFLYFMTEYLQD